MGGLPYVRIQVDPLSSALLTLTLGSYFLQGFTKYEFRMTPKPLTSADDTYSGGPAGVIYGYFFVWLGTLAVFLTLSEATSI